jgi:hypothetical protein
MKKQHSVKPGGKRKSPVEGVKQRPNVKNAKDVFGLLGGVSLVAFAIAAHLYVNVQGPGYVGPLLVLDHVFDLILALGLLAICASLGNFVLVRCGCRFDQPLETLLFSTAIGAGLLSTSILICGLLSGLNAPILGALLLFFAFLTRKELRELPTLVVQSFSSLRTNSPVWGLTIFGAVAFFMLSEAMAPPLDWDSLMYHLRVPAQFLQHGRIYLPEDNLHTAFVQLAHMLYLPLLAFGSPAGAALVSAFFALGLGLAVFALSLRFLNRATAGLSLALLWGSTSLLLIAITPRVDVTLAYYLFLAHYALLMALHDTEGRPFFFLSGALLGLAFGVKYSALFYILALSPLILWVTRSRFPGVAAFSRALAFFGLTVLGSALPWLIKNWLLHAAPLFPYFSARGIEPWLAPLYGGQSVVVDISEMIREWNRQVSIPFNLLDLFISPGRLEVEDEAVLYALNPIFLLLPLWLLFLPGRTLSWLIIPALCHVIGLVLYLPSNNLRYLIPAVAPLTIVATYIIDRLRLRFLSPKAATWVSVLIIGVALLPSGKIIGLRLTEGMALKYLSGTISWESYVRRNPFPFGNRAYADVAFYVNRHVPPDSRILMIYDARGYYFTVPVIQDNWPTNWPLLSQTQAVRNCLRSTGISHILVNSGALSYYTRRGMDPRLLQWDAFRQFAEKCLLPVHEAQGFILYRVKE